MSLLFMIATLLLLVLMLARCPENVNATASIDTRKTTALVFLAVGIFFSPAGILSGELAEEEAAVPLLLLPFVMAIEFCRGVMASWEYNIILLQ